MRSKLILGTLGLFAFAAMVITSCENKEALLPTTVLSASCDTTHLTYNGGIDTIINTQCAVSGCHVPHSTAPNYNTYAALSANASGGTSSLFYGDLVKGNPHVMPNVPQPGWNSNPCLKAKLVQWVLDGAPQ